MSAPKFAVGEIAILAEATNFVSYKGQDVEIIRLPTGTNWIAPNGKIIKAGFYWIMAGDGHSFQCKEQRLRKKPGKKDDGRQVTSWDKCLFQPNGVKA